MLKSWKTTITLLLAFVSILVVAGGDIAEACAGPGWGDYAWVVSCGPSETCVTYPYCREDQCYCGTGLGSHAFLCVPTSEWCFSQAVSPCPSGSC